MVTNTHLHLEGIRAERRDQAAELAGLISALAGPKLLGLTAYGSCVSAEYDGTAGRLTCVAVLDTINLDQLAELAEHGRRLARLDVAAPLVMTPASIDRSRDTFALELLELTQFRTTLLGRDYFADLSIESEHLRLQIERSFKLMLIDLRQGLLHSIGREGLLSEVVESIGERLLRTLRGLLWLRGRREPMSRPHVVAAAAKLAGRELPGVRDAAADKLMHDWNEFKALYADLERLAALSDEMV
jgi:hypothetical protein